jgi:hypothetical protein
MERYLLQLACAPFILLASCSTMAAMVRTPEQQAAHEIETCTEKDVATYDLGTGRAVDIRRRSPTFFALRGAGWQPPTTFMAVDSEAQVRAELRQRNQRHLQALRRAPLSGFELNPVMVDDLEVVDVVPSAPEVPGTIRAFRIDKRNVALLFTPGQCPHVFVDDSCDGGKLLSRPHTDGMLPCMNAQSFAEDHAWMVVNDSAPGAIKFGKVIFADVPLSGFQRVSNGTSEAINISLHLDARSASIADGSVSVGEFGSARPEELLALAMAGVLEQPVLLGYRTLTDQERSSDFDAQLASARAEAAKAAVSKLNDAGSFIGYRGTVVLRGGLPGDDAVVEALRPLQRQLLARIATSELTDKTAATGLVLVAALHEDGSEFVPEETALGDAVGARLANGDLSGEALQETYAKIFRDSPYVKQLAERLTREGMEKRQAAAAVERNHEIDEAWYNLYHHADKVAELRYGSDFALKVSVSPQTRIGATNMKLHRKMIIEQELCPAVREFVKMTSKAELRKRAAEHCAQEPPTGPALGGDSVELVSDCKAAFELCD